MDDDFDVNAAVDDIGAGLGFGSEETGADDGPVLDVEAKVIPDTEQKALAAPTEGTAATPAEGTAPTGESTAVAKPTEVDAPPLTWRKEASALWAQLPSEIKAEVLKREADIFKGIETYKEAAGFGKSMKAVVAPYEGYMRAAGTTPEAAITGMLRGHHVLGTGTPAEKIATLQSLAKAYNIDISAAAQPAGEAPYIDPAVAALQNELRSVQSVLERAQNKEREAAVSNISAQVDQFASDPANVYFGEVAGQVATLLQSGVANSLKDAYEQAIWANPTTRAKELARTTAEASAKAATEAASKVAQAKKATAANVSTRAKSGSATTTTGSLDDTLNEALADIRSRG